MKKYINKKLGIIFSASLIAVSLIGCTKKEEVVDNCLIEFDFGIVTSSADPSEASKYTYQINDYAYSEVKGNYIISNNAYGIIDGSCAVVSTVNDSSDNYVSKLALSKLNASNGIESTYYLSLPDETLYVPSEISRLVEDTNSYLASTLSDDEYVEEKYQCSTGFGNISILDDGNVIGIVDFYYSYYSSAYFSSINDTESFLCKWDKQGNLKWSSKIRDKEITDYITVFKSIVADGKYFFITAVNNTDFKETVFDANGNIVNNNRVSADSNLLKIEDVISTKDGKYIAFYKDEADLQRASYFDASSGTLSGDITLPDYLVLNGYYSISAGYDKDIVFSDAIGMYSCNINSNSFDVVMDYANSDFTGISVNEVNFVSATKFYGVYYDLVNYSTHIASFDAGSATDNSTKAIVILGSYKLPANARKQILDFNNENEIYRIIVKEYSYLDKVSEPRLGCKTLEEDILAGTGPDLTMIDPGLVNTYSLANNGKLIPLSYLVNIDTQFSGTDYITSVLDAYAINGLDYILIYDFRYRTFLGSSDIVGNGSSWSVKDFTKALGKAPSDDAVMYIYNTRADFLDKLIMFNASEYIDFDNKKCKFNSSDFIDMLKYGADLPADVVDDSEIYESVSTSYRNGNILLKEEIVIEADAFWNDAYRLFDGKASVIGFPSSNSQSSVIEYVDTPIMIMNGSNVNGAWIFAKTYYSFNYQSGISNAIPVSYTAFDAWGKRALYNQNYAGVNELGESYSHQATYYYDGSEHVIPDIAIENIELIEANILASTKAVYCDETVKAIITEEAIKCFNGSQSAKDAAANIDSRVSQYLFN